MQSKRHTKLVQTTPKLHAARVYGTREDHFDSSPLGVLVLLHGYSYRNLVKYSDGDIFLTLRVSYCDRVVLCVEFGFSLKENQAFQAQPVF